MKPVPTSIFAFLELTKHPEIQKKLRDEIGATRAATRARGKIDFEHSGYEGMAYLNVFIKVCQPHSQTLDTN